MGHFQHHGRLIDEKLLEWHLELDKQPKLNMSISNAENIFVYTTFRTPNACPSRQPVGGHLLEKSLTGNIYEKQWALYQTCFLSPSLSLFLSLSETAPCIFLFQMMDGKTKIGPLAIMFFSVQLVETGKAISVRQESSRTDLERKYYPGLLEIEVPWCRAYEMKMVHIDILLLSNRGNVRRYKAKMAQSNPTRPASWLRPGKTWLGTVSCLEHLISACSMVVAEARAVPTSLHSGQSPASSAFT